LKCWRHFDDETGLIQQDSCDLRGEKGGHFGTGEDSVVQICSVIG